MNQPTAPSQLPTKPPSSPVPPGQPPDSLLEGVSLRARLLLEWLPLALALIGLGTGAVQSAIDSIPDPVVIFDLEGHILNVNRSAEALLLIRASSEGSEPLARVPGRIKETLLHVFRHIVQGKGAYVPRGFEEAVPCTATDGERFFLPRAEPVYREQEGIVGATIILQDVTRLRRFDELKNDLVATVAHEFRTPLTSLRMAIHLCLEELVGPLTPKQTELLDAAREDCERLQHIVDDLLDLARLQAGRLEMHPIALEPEALVSSVVGHWTTMAADKGIALRAEVTPLLPEVWADDERIRIVFANLIANALRHTPHGGTVIVGAQLSQAFPGMVRFEVRDTGEGIPTELQATIFERFQQGEGEKVGSAGLGLSICREIVRAHRGTRAGGRDGSTQAGDTGAGTVLTTSQASALALGERPEPPERRGEIGVESLPGQGACFWFVLPLLEG